MNLNNKDGGNIDYLCNIFACVLSLKRDKRILNRELIAVVLIEDTSSVPDF